MGQSAKPWTTVMENFLAAAKGEWCDTDEVLALGASEVTQERALQEMGSKQTGHAEERRVQIGKRNVAQQSLTGMVRFGKAEYGEGRKKIRKTAETASPGALAARVTQLEAQVEELVGQVSSMQAQLDRLDESTE